MVGLVLYISSINDEVMNRPSSSEQYFHYRYGWSFAFAASSFLLKEVMSWGPECRALEAGRWGRTLWIRREVVAEGLTPGSEGGGLAFWSLGLKKEDCGTLGSWGRKGWALIPGVWGRTKLGPWDLGEEGSGVPSRGQAGGQGLAVA